MIRLGWYQCPQCELVVLIDHASERTEELQLACPLLCGRMVWVGEWDPDNPS